MTEQAGYTRGPLQLFEVGDGPKALAPATMDRESLLTIVEEDGIPFAAFLRKADARLCIAAPDLLEALKEIAKTDLAQVNGYAQGWVKALIKTANGAILKATKEQA